MTIHPEVFLVVCGWLFDEQLFRWGCAGGRCAACWDQEIHSGGADQAQQLGLGLGVLPPGVRRAVCALLCDLKTLLAARQASSALKHAAAERVQTLLAEQALLPPQAYAAFSRATGLLVRVSPGCLNTEQALQQLQALLAGMCEFWACVPGACASPTPHRHGPPTGLNENTRSGSRPCGPAPRVACLAVRRTPRHTRAGRRRHGTGTQVRALRSCFARSPSLYIRGGVRRTVHADKSARPPSDLPAL